MEVDLEVVGRHAMLFDDDATLEFVNSKEALIEWNSLFIDRFDVRNLIDVAPPSFRHLPPAYYGGGSFSGVLPDDDSHLFADLDTERFADLFAVNDDDNDDIQLDEKGAMDAGGYNFVPFSYGNSADSTVQKDSGMDMNASSFRPSFFVPESLLHNLPPSEKVHQIIARTAMFVGEHGGQSEIVLRVKQGDNPTFGFLMPHHHLHPYFRYLVEHPEFLKADNDSKSQRDKSNGVQATGALSLLGSIYGSGDDEDVEAKVEIKSEQTVSGGNASASDVPTPDKLEQALSSGDGAQKDESVAVHSQTSKVKVSAPSTKSITSIKPGRASSIKSYGSISSSISSSIEKPKASSLFPLAHAEKSLVDPPSEMKKLVDRVVEIILKNGKDFETVLIEQDKKHGKFPFLLPSNQYHIYYLRVLKKAQESRISGKTFGSGKDGSSWQEIEKDAGHQMKESECTSLDGSDDLDIDYDKKDKFKMVIPKTKRDSQEQSSKESQQQPRFTVDATAAAAILQAATRGIRNPNLKIFSNKTSQDSGIERGPSSNSALKENGESCRTARGDKDTTKIAAGEADTSDSELTRQQKLKAERLRRAKMFAAMIKSGADPLGTEPPRSSSLEPPGSGSETGPGHSSLGDKSVVEEVKGREGSYPLMESNDENEQKLNKRRHYRSRKHDDGQGEEESKENDEDTGEDDDEKSRSTKRHKSRHSSRRHRDRSKDRHKHRRRHSSSKSKESRHRHKHDSSSEDDDDRHHRQKSDSSLEEERKHHKRRHKHESSSEEESKHVKRRHKESSRKHRHRERSGKNDRSHAEQGELEEGEIRTRSSDQSLSAIGEDASREASVDASKSPLREKRSSLPPPQPTEVPDELRAKIRAMLLATM